MENTTWDFETLRAVALGHSDADLLFINGQVVSVFSGQVIRTGVVVKGAYIAGLGNYERAKTIIDLEGRYLLPGFIDSHIHIESSMLTPGAFAQATVPHGTAAVLADPHEIVNVLGLEGWSYMLDASRDLPLDFSWTVPSCVPATHMETSGGTMGAEELLQALEIFPSCLALAEMMNFPGVIYGDPKVVKLIETARLRGLVLEGHAPGLSGLALNAYLASGCNSDHECTSPEEALEKLERGMRLLVREGSAAHNLDQLLPVINSGNYHRCCFCSDDRHPRDLIEQGHIDHILRTAVAKGFPALQAIQMATLNPAVHYGLKRQGAIAPGYYADLAVVEDLELFKVLEVYKRGRKVAEHGKNLWSNSGSEPSGVRGTVRLPDLRGKLFAQPSSTAGLANVIELVPGQILTHKTLMPNSEVLHSPEVNRLAVIERHGKNGNIARGLVKGLSLRRGAIASTVAHDSHNLIVAGKDATSMETAAAAVASMGGGMAVVEGERILAALPLPVAGLMSSHPVEQVAREYEQVVQAARSLGCTTQAPFMNLSFLSLPVIPELRLSDCGLIDVAAFSIIDLWE